MTRQQLNYELNELVLRLESMNVGQNPGLLNYAITSLVLRTMPRGSYSDLNQIVGVLDSVKVEFQRRAVASYEDEKVRLNGDVY